MSNDLVRQALELDDHLSAPAEKPNRDYFRKSKKKRERAKRLKSSKPVVVPDLVERNVQTMLRNRKTVEGRKHKKFIKKLTLDRMPKWQQPEKKKKKKKEEDVIPDSAYDISDVNL